MKANEIIEAMQLIQDMEDAKKERGAIKDYSIEAVTEALGVSASKICVHVYETAWIGASYFYFVDIGSRRVYDAHRCVVFPE